MKSISKNFMQCKPFCCRSIGIAGTFLKHVRVLVQPSFVGSPHGTAYSYEESPFMRTYKVVCFHEDLDLIQSRVYARNSIHVYSQIKNSSFQHQSTIYLLNNIFETCYGEVDNKFKYKRKPSYFYRINISADFARV